MKTNAMKNATNDIAKALSPRFMNKALETLDRASMIVVALCWGGALAFSALAVYTINSAVVARNEATRVAASEPLLPKITKKPPDIKDVQPLIDRLQKRFPEINFSLSSDKSLTVSSTDGAKFRQWLTVLGYIDTALPQYRWAIKEFCVGGACGGSVLMKSTLTAEKLTFSFPEVEGQ